MTYTRRQMVRFLGGVVAFLEATPAADAQGKMSATVQAPRAPTLRLVLDTMEGGVQVVYHGQAVQVTPQEIMDALRTGAKGDE